MELDGRKSRDTQEKHRRWWKREGVVISRWLPFISTSTESSPSVNAGAPENAWLDIEQISTRITREMPITSFPADMAPIANFSGWGPGCLAAYLGARSEFAENTVWFFPREDDPESWPEFRFDPENQWWKLHETILRRLVKEAKGRYLIGCPDLVENLDTLCSLRDSQEIMIDMIEKPEWVIQKIKEVNKVWFDTYQRIWEIIKCDDDSSAYHAFGIWGDGKTAKLQCDASAMISQDMFDEFVVPSLAEQADWLDNAVYHLDGTQALRHLDSLLAIKGLDAIEWTPQAGIEGGGDRRWYEIYRKIIDAGKAVMAVHVNAADVIPLLDEVGTAGIFLHICDLETTGELDALANEVHRRF